MFEMKLFFLKLLYAISRLMDVAAERGVAKKRCKSRYEVNESIPYIYRYSVPINFVFRKSFQFEIMNLFLFIF